MTSMSAGVPFVVSGQEISRLPSASTTERPSVRHVRKWIFQASASASLASSLPSSTPTQPQPLPIVPDWEFVASAFHRTSTSRSEEHTSELQSIMRISYAVFFLKQKKTHSNQLS